MSVKTLQFDRALDAIFEKLRSHERECRRCKQQFKIVAEDIDFYKKLRVPPPTMCPRCRAQTIFGSRLSFLPIFYKKKCSAPGHNESVVSFYSERNPVKVYDDKFYVSDGWDPLSFGRDYDSNKPFFSQFNELALSVPHQTLQRDLTSVNCDYTVSGAASKNCYYLAVPYHAEDVQYGFLGYYSRNSLDVNLIENSELCYESGSLQESYNCSFCYKSIACVDSYFLLDCHNCTHCFGCTNLRNKKYCFFNEQLSKEEYEKRVKAINLGSRKAVREYQKKFDDLTKKAIWKYVDNVKVENCVGNEIDESKNCYYVFWVIGCKDMRYIYSAERSDTAMDVMGIGVSSRAYYSSGVIAASDVRFSVMTRAGLDVEYSVECANCEHIFGCYGLKNKKYCIFNKQYTEEEYWKQLDEIKIKMLQRGEYGEHFPLEISPHPYADSNASIEYPLSKEEVLKRGWHWEDPVEEAVDLSGIQALKAEEVPDDIANTTDDILSKAILCEKTGKPFRYTKFELDFHRHQRIALPTVHPLERTRDRFKWRSPFKLFATTCSKCGKQIESGYDPINKLTIYCEQCYLKEIV